MMMLLRRGTCFFVVISYTSVVGRFPGFSSIKPSFNYTDSSTDLVIKLDDDLLYVLINFFPATNRKRLL